MKNLKGMTFIGMLLTMVAVMTMGLLALKMIPVYLEHYAVIRALNNLSQFDRSDVSNDVSENTIWIKRTLRKQFEIENIDYITEDNIIIQPENDNKVIVSIRYQVTKPFIANISLLFDFNNNKEVTFASQ